MKFFVESTDTKQKFEVVKVDPETGNATIVAAGLRLLVNLEPDLLADLNLKLVQEDGTNAKLEELQAQLQAGVQDPEAKG